MAELIRFLDRDNWSEIKRGHVFDAVSYYNTDTRRPLTFFIPDETQQEGQPITGKLVESVGDFESVEIDGVMKSPEHKVVVGMKQRRVVVLSNNRFSQDSSYEYIYVAPIMSVHDKDRGKKWYDKMIHDDHPMNIYVPRRDDGYERYISLAQITSIHKGSLLRNVHEEIHEERLALVGSHLNYILDLGLMEPEEAEQVIEETGTE